MITAVLLAYYPERAGNLKKIHDALTTGTVIPNRIIIVNNNKDLKFDFAETITASKNLGHRARFVFALAIPSDYYFFIDDDMTVGPKTIENYLKYAHRDCCLTQGGKILMENGRYASSKIIWGSQIDELMDVEITVGIGSIFCSFQSLVNMLSLDSNMLKHPAWNGGREADIVLGMANKPQIVPTDKTSAIKSIGQKGVAMSKDSGHVQKRNDIVEVIKSLKGDN